MPTPFCFQPLEIPGIILIEPERLEDERGSFAEIYKLSALPASEISTAFVQCNYSHSARGVLRGLQNQKYRKAQGKLVAAIRGRIFDVAVDIREGSPTCGGWVSTMLSHDNGHVLFIPPGFANGFCVLSQEADIIYEMTAGFAPELDRGIIWNDREINIHWPMSEPILSPKDAALPSIQEVDNNLAL